MSRDADREHRNRTSSHEVGKRASTEQYGNGTSQVHSRVPGKMSGTQHLPAATAGAGRTDAEGVAETIEVARRQLASLEQLLPGAERGRSAGQAWVLQATLYSIEQLLANAGDDERIVRLRSEAELLIAQGRARLAEARGTQAKPGSTLDTSQALGAVSQPVPTLDEGVRPSAAQRLPDSLKSELEAATAANLGDVNIHDTDHGHVIAASHGANAVTINSDIFFAVGKYQPESREGRELIAHEVAHVIQSGSAKPAAQSQSSGESSHEDAEADAEGFARGFGKGGAAAQWKPAAVVAAHAAKRSPAGTSPVGSAVRAAMDSAVAANKKDVAWAYLRKNEEKFLGAIELALVGLAPPADPRITWLNKGLSTRFRAALMAALSGDPLWIRLPDFVTPADPWYFIDQNRPLTEGTPGVSVDGKDPVGPLAWSDRAGTALSYLVYKVLTESLQRMVPRFATQIDWKAPDAVLLEDLVPSHPMDRITSFLLLDPAVAKPLPKTTKPGTKKHKGPDDGANFKYGIEFLKDWRWLGEVEPDLWNYVEAKDPKDPTPEQVIASLFGTLEGAQYAYAVRKSGSYFRIDPPLARKFTRDLKPQIDDKTANNVLVLADSGFATDAAIQQAAGERRFDKHHHALPPDLKTLGETLEKSHRSLERVKQALPTKLFSLVLPALKWVNKQRENLMATPNERLSALTPVIQGQSEILFEAEGEIARLLDMVDLGKLDDPRDTTRVVLDTMREYAIVCGESHLIESAREHLNVAHQSMRQLPIAMLEISAVDTGAAVEQLAESRGASPSVEDRKLAFKNEQYRVSSLRAMQAMGQSVDPNLVANSAASLREQAIDSRVEALSDQIAALRNAASDSKSGTFEVIATIFSSDIRSLPRELDSILTDLIDNVQQPHRDAKSRRMEQAGADMNAQTGALNDAAQMTELNLAEFVKRHHLDDKMRKALEVIEKQQIRTAVVRIITQILVLVASSVAAGVIGNIVAGAVRGAMVADAATASVGMLRTARVVGAVTGMTVDAGINTGVQVAVQGGDAKEAFVANFLGAAALRLALAPLTKATQAWGAVGHELEAAGKWQKVGRASKFVLKEGAVFTASMITNVATDYVVHRIFHSDEPPTEKQAVDWAVHGGSMAIGMFVGRWTHDFEGRAVKAAEEFGYRTLRDRAFKVRKLAAHVEKTGDPDAALELLIQRHEVLQEEARVIEEATKAAKGQPSTLLETMRMGNSTDQAAVKDAAFAQVPLRLAGIEPENASGKIWAGATEDIAIALHQAERVGLRVEVLSHDTAAREWKILYNGEQITIIETKASGRPRAAKSEVTDADRAHAQRYAESAVFMQEKWEAKVKNEFDSREVIDVEHLQVGYAYAGVVNQATLPAQGQGLDNRVIVYKHKGTLSGRGEQELGQPPTKFDAPGVRATEQAPNDSRWIKSKELNQALDIGRIENQTPAYRGEAVALETRDKASATDPWKAANRKFRIKIRDAGNTERWFYCDTFDNAGGLGPGSTKELEKVVVDEPLRNAMMAGEQPLLLQGEDPDYLHKLKRGDILIWGGTATGAWAAEPVKASPRSHATVLGDTRPPADWARLFDEYNDLHESIAAMGEQAPAELKNRLAAIEAMITDAHAGSKIPRNRKPGATYEKPVRGERGPGDVRIEFGTPSQLKPTGDGRVLVTVGTGENARTRIYDQVVLAHGQDPAKGPAALLGKGAAAEPGADPKHKEYGEVPQGTIALKPIWGPKNDQGRRSILGLESIDPPGIVLKGAAYANKKMSPWVAKNERAAFEHEVDAMSAENAVTRDHGEISPDSYGVSGGMEVQRDRIPRANEVLNAKKLTLPGPDKTLELGTDESTWDDKVREFFAINLKADHRWVSVKRLGGGATKAVVYHVSVDGSEVGIFKLFDVRSSAPNEQRTLDMLQAAKLKTMKVVSGRGTVKLDRQTGYSGAILMDVAQGTTVKEMIAALPDDPRLRAKSTEKLTRAVEKVAVGLAEMHVHFGDNSTQKPAMMSEAAKKSDANYFLDKAFRSGGRDYDKVHATLGEDFDRVKSVAEHKMYEEFIASEVPATAYHGDANAGNFALSGNNNSELTMFDVDKMQWSVPDGSFDGNMTNVKGTKTGAADVARFLNSLETLAPGKLRPDELNALRNAFKDAYFAKYRVGSDRHRVSRAEYDKAERWYQLEMEMAIIDKPGAKERVLKLVAQDGGS